MTEGRGRRPVRSGSRWFGEMRQPRPARSRSTDPHPPVSPEHRARSSSWGAGAGGRSSSSARAMPRHQAGDRGPTRSVRGTSRRRLSSTRRRRQTFRTAPGGAYETTPRAPHRSPRQTPPACEYGASCSANPRSRRRRCRRPRPRRPRRPRRSPPARRRDRCSCRQPRTPRADTRSASSDRRHLDRRTRTDSDRA